MHRAAEADGGPSRRRRRGGRWFGRACSWQQLRRRRWFGRVCSWQRLRSAHDRLVDLPPIDVVKYADGYWVLDGHNRVGLALYAGQVGIDASIVELVAPGAQRTEPLGSLAAEVEAARELRGRVDAESAATSSGDD